MVLIIIKKEKSEPLRKRGGRAALPSVLEWGSGIPVPFRYWGPPSCFLSPPAGPPPASRASPAHSPPSPLPPPQQLVLFVFPDQLCSGLPEGWMHRWLCLPAQHHHPYLLHIHSLSWEGVGEGVRKTKKKKVSSGLHIQETSGSHQDLITQRELATLSSASSHIGTFGPTEKSSGFLLSMILLKHSSQKHRKIPQRSPKTQSCILSEALDPTQMPIPYGEISI